MSTWRPQVFVTYCGRFEMFVRLGDSLDRLNMAAGMTVIDNTGGTLSPSSRALHWSHWINVVRADNAHRHLAAWALGLVPTDRPYIVTEEDIEVAPDCPDDLVLQLLAALDRHPGMEKVGPSIRTDDVPDIERHRAALHHERVYNARKGPDPMLLDFPVDTHFALYRGGAVNTGINGARLRAPYCVSHQPWYNDEPTAEELAYFARVGPDWLRRGTDTAHLVPER